MIPYRLLKHRWKHFWRTTPSGQRLLRIVGIPTLGVYLAFELWRTGGEFAQSLRAIAEVSTPLQLIEKILLPAFAALVVLRFFMQCSLQVSLQSYLHLPVSRSKLASFVQWTSLASLFNVLPFFFFAPLCIHASESRGVAEATGWMAGFALLVLTTHYLFVCLRIFANVRRRTFLATASVVTLAMAGGYLQAEPFMRGLSQYLFSWLLSGDTLPFLALVGLLTASYSASQKAVEHVLYQNNSTGTPITLASSDLRRLAFHRIGNRPLLRTELRLIGRNKRPRQTILIAALLILYPAIMLTGELASDPFIGLTACYMGTFALPALYGQHLFAWESSHFDGLSRMAVEAHDLIEGKLLLLQLMCVASYLISAPIFVWMAPSFLMLHAAFLLYNIGFACALVVAISFFNRQRIDVSESQFMNYEGANVYNVFLLGVGGMAPPVVLYALFGLSLTQVILGGLGITGLFLRKMQVRLLAKEFEKHRYSMASGFRS
jgi:hypothetical protein